MGPPWSISLQQRTFKLRVHKLEKENAAEMGTQNSRWTWPDVVEHIECRGAGFDSEVGAESMLQAQAEIRPGSIPCS
jgi:hypothetical protein